MARAPLSYASQRQSIVEAAELLVRSGVLSHSGHGNSSVRLPDGQAMLITGVSSLLTTTPESLGVTDLDGTVLEKTDSDKVLAPGVRCYPTSRSPPHGEYPRERGVYREFPRRCPAGCSAVGPAPSGSTMPIVAGRASASKATSPIV